MPKVAEGIVPYNCPGRFGGMEAAVCDRRLSWPGRCVEALRLEQA